MRKAALRDIQPCRGVIFNNCTYPIRFSVAAYYQRSALPLIFNEFHTYGCQRDELLQRHLLFVHTHLQRPADLVLQNDMGIVPLNKARAEDVVGDLKRAIDDRLPVMVCVDRFHQPFASEYFQRKHHLHSILVHGYDDGSQSFQIFDDQYLDQGENVVSCAISYDDLGRAYQSCFEQWPQPLQALPTFVAFADDSAAAATARPSARQCRTRFLAAVQGAKSLFREGLAGLQLFVERFHEEAAGTDLSPQALDMYHLMFRRITDFKVTHHYQILQLFEDPAALAVETTALIKAWNQLRLRILKLSLASGVQDVRPRLKDLSSNLTLARDLEVRYQDLFSQATGRLAESLAAPPAA
jgi:hypothetical protein